MKKKIGTCQHVRITIPELVKPREANGCVLQFSPLPGITFPKNQNNLLTNQGNFTEKADPVSYNIYLKGSSARSILTSKEVDAGRLDKENVTSPMLFYADTPILRWRKLKKSMNTADVWFFVNGPIH